MCGICGIHYFDSRPVDESKIRSMAGALVHRGPDDEGFYFSRETPSGSGAGQTGLGFRRLSIIDVAGGHQPMRLGGKVIVFNGEIYNYRDLKSECLSWGRSFQTQSDTEVLLHQFDRFREKSFSRLNGMFAFAVWDEAERELWLCRDPLGIKPLYYYCDGQKIVFASELKALLRSGEVPLEFDGRALLDYYSYRFVPGPWTVLKNVRKVLPGEYLRVKNGALRAQKYWQWERRDLERASFADLERELHALLDQSVRSQMVSDVPLGAFLSGGVDSSLIAALMSRHASAKVKTFSIGFEKGTGVDESAHARRVARHIGSEHHEWILTARDLPNADAVFGRMNEPVADPTVLPTAILSQFARREVKVVLTGEGGDELFAGYNRYKAVLYAEWADLWPAWLRPAAGALFRRFGKGEAFSALPDLEAQNWFLLNRDFSAGVLKSVFGNALPEKGYLPEIAALRPKSPGRLNAVLDLERDTALTDRLLMKVDMASMGQSLEARPPFLDPAVVAFASSLPSRHKIRRFKGKYILRKTAERYLPAAVAWRRKHGFIVPLRRWLDAGSGEWVRGALENPALDSVGFFDRKSIQKAAEKIYNSENSEAVVTLWPVIVLSSWLKGLENGS